MKEKNLNRGIKLINDHNNDHSKDDNKKSIADYE